MQLNLTVSFAERRYHGRKSNGEGGLEYPPSPSRLFQALIAGSHCGAYSLVHTEKRDHALRWLESLKPPMIETPPVCETGQAFTNYVPNNDDKYGNDPGSGHVRTAKSLLAKVFPSRHTLIYRWSFEINPEAREYAAVICAMARLITHLGQHQDTVYVQGEIVDTIHETTSSDVMYPIEKSNGDWTSPQTGALDAYCQQYQVWLKGGSKDNVSIPLQNVHYRSSDTISFDAPMALFELWQNEDDRLRYDPRDLLQLTKMVRQTMLTWVKERPAFSEHYGEEQILRLLAGYETNKHHHGPHIACVPIPSLNESGIADGLIRRVLLIGFGCEQNPASEFFESLALGINGMALQNQQTHMGYLKRASLHDSVLRLFTNRSYCVWRTVTPIILTGLMRRGRPAEVLIARALQQIGIHESDIDSIAAFRGPIVPKTIHSQHYRIGKDCYLAQTNRYHAEIIFKRAVEGPLVIGRGRYCGFGLMLPTFEKTPFFLDE